MARRKLEIKITDEQINTLQISLAAGAPLDLALQRVGVSLATYYYWVAIASIVVVVKDREEIEELEAIANSGVSVANIREMAANSKKSDRQAVGAFIEPSEASILAYKNSRKFKRFADRCFEIIDGCNRKRAEFATAQLSKIARSTEKKNGINPSGAMWWLERNMPDQFAKPSDKAIESETANNTSVPAIEVEFIDPNTKENRDRLLDMENEILNDMKQGGKA